MLRRLATNGRGQAEPVEELAARLLADVAERRQYGLELRDRRIAGRTATYEVLEAEGMDEQEVIDEVIAIIRAVRSEKSLWDREDERRGGGY